MYVKCKYVEWIMFIITGYLKCQFWADSSAYSGKDKINIRTENDLSMW